MGKYDDIINLKRPASKHPKMSLYQRSAQFAPYSALTGYEGQVKETARLTDRRIELDEELKVILDMKIQVIQEKTLLTSGIRIQNVLLHFYNGYMLREKTWLMEGFCNITELKWEII